MVGNNRVVVFNADDFGLTSGVCEAILQAAAGTGGATGGVATSTSVLAVGPAWGNYASRLASSGLGVGVHFCMVGEDPPLLSAREVPTLVDTGGRFPLTWREVVLRALRGTIDFDDVRREFAAQFEAVKSALLGDSAAMITHVDAHQNLHIWPGVSKVVWELAAEHGVRATRVPRTTTWSPRAVGVRSLGGLYSRRSSAQGMNVPAASAGLDEAGQMTEAAMIAAIERNRTADSLDISCHPGLADDPDRSRYEWGYRWDRDFAGLTSPAVRATVERCGFRLGTFADIAGGSDAAPE